MSRQEIYLHEQEFSNLEQKLKTWRKINKEIETMEKKTNRNHGNKRMIKLMKKFKNTDRPSENFVNRQD